MNHKSKKQIAAFLLSGVLLASGAAGWLPSATQNSILNLFSIVVSDDLSAIGVTLDVYTHLGLEDAAEELRRMEELQNARQEMNRTKDEAV